MPPGEAPHLGVGLVWWPELDAPCDPREGLVDVVEVARDAAELLPVFTSEHLSFSQFREAPGAAPTCAGFLLPPLQSAASVELAARRIRARRHALGGFGLAIETPVSYLPPLPGEWRSRAAPSFALYRKLIGEARAFLGFVENMRAVTPELAAAMALDSAAW
jgi:hypothetical protein